MLKISLHIFGKNHQLNKIKNFLLMIFVEMSDKIKILLAEQEDKGQPYFAAAKMMRGWFNVVDSSF